MGETVDAPRLMLNPFNRSGRLEKVIIDRCWVSSLDQSRSKHAEATGSGELLLDGTALALPYLCDQF